MWWFSKQLIKITAAHIANYIFYQAKKDQVLITPLKLQKLIYFLFGHYFNFSDQKLFNDRFYAWEHGPVIPHLYYQLKKHQANPIPLDTLVWHADFKKEKFMPASLSDLTNNQFNILYSIWEHYSQIDARKLVILSHQKNTP